MTIKNNSELLRCFEILARRFTDNVVTFLQRSLDTREPAIRAGTLSIFKHVVSRCDAEMTQYRDMIISYIMPMTQEPAYICKRELMQLITVMARLRYLSLEGGQTLCRYIVRLASTTNAEVERSNEEAAKVVFAHICVPSSSIFSPHL